MAIGLRVASLFKRLFGKTWDEGFFFVLDKIWDAAKPVAVDRIEKINVDPRKLVGELVLSLGTFEKEGTFLNRARCALARDALIDKMTAAVADKSDPTRENREVAVLAEFLAYIEERGKDFLLPRVNAQGQEVGKPHVLNVRDQQKMGLVLIGELPLDRYRTVLEGLRHNPWEQYMKLVVAKLDQGLRPMTEWLRNHNTIYGQSVRGRYTNKGYRY